MDLSPLQSINLSSGPPGMEDDALARWWEKEQSAFKDTSAWDEQAQLNVSQVAVSVAGSIRDFFHK